MALLAAACAPAIRAVQEDTRGLLIPTAGTNESVILVAPVETGMLVVDLGWSGARAELARALEHLGASPDDVTAVLLTHAHRDHISAWPLVANAPFYMAAAEADLFLGRAPPEGALVRLGHRIKPAPRPAPAELDVRTFSGDTVLTFGRDTVRAFAVPGHTAGSTAYLFRGVLFIGDALSAAPFGGLRPAVGVYSADPEQAAASIAALWSRLEGLEVRWVCTAHGRCIRYDPEGEGL